MWGIETQTSASCVFLFSFVSHLLVCLVLLVHVYVNFVNQPWCTSEGGNGASRGTPFSTEFVWQFQEPDYSFSSDIRMSLSVICA